MILPIHYFDESDKLLQIIPFARDACGHQMCNVQRCPLLVPKNHQDMDGFDWCATLKMICAQFSFTRATLITGRSVSIAKICTCEMNYHALADCVADACTALNTTCDKIITHADTLDYTIRNRCYVVNDSRKLLCAPLYYANGDFIGGLIAYKEDVQCNDIYTISCFLKELSLAIVCHASELSRSALQRDLNEVTNRSLEQVRHAQKMRDTFIATMSHELRTPLTSLIAANQLLHTVNIDSVNAERIRKLLSIQNECSMQLLQLINDILDFCKLKSTELQLKSEYLNLHDLLASIVRFFEAQCMESDTCLYIEKDESVRDDETLKIYADGKRMKQIFLNIVNNSFKYLRSNVPGKITIRCKMEAADRNEIDADVRIFRFEIEDNGCGIKQENLDFIFEPYFSEKRDDWTHVLNGIGLGLAIVRDLIDLMGGKIEAESVLNSHTRITFRLPFKVKSLKKTIGSDTSSLSSIMSIEKRRRESFVTTADHNKDDSLVNFLSDKNVLIIDDRFEQRMLLLKYIKNWNMQGQILLASCSAEATSMVSMLNDRGESFDLAFVDIDLSLSDAFDSGVKFANYVRSSHVPMFLIAVSSIGGSFAGDGFFDVILTKPITEKNLLGALYKFKVKKSNTSNTSSTPISTSLVLKTTSTTDSNNSGSSMCRSMSTNDLQYHNDNMSPLMLPTCDDFSEFASVRTASNYINNPKGSLKGSNDQLLQYELHELQVLVVDDNETNGRMFVSMLYECGVKKVDYVPSAKLALLHAAHVLYNVIFMDLIMPEIDGIQCTKEILNDTNRYGTPKIVAFTADALDSTQEKCKTFGFTEFLAKPFTMDDLRQILVRLVE